MDVVDWQDSPLPIVTEARPTRLFFPPALIGIFGTLLLHALIIQSLPFGSRGPKPKPPETLESANALSKSTTDADTLVLISLPATANGSQATSESTLSSLPDLKKIKINLPIKVDLPEFLSLESLPLSEALASNPSARGGDGAELAQMFGIYTGQIQARIDRVWRRPRTPVSDASARIGQSEDSFQCEAQIVQDIRGNVQEILLPRCNGSPAWQRSLVVAIQQASPLPAPPDPKVFMHSIVVRFVGLPYVVGNSEDGYELSTRGVATANSLGPRTQ
jgi:hypothetical protein